MNASMDYAVVIYRLTLFLPSIIFAQFSDSSGSLNEPNEDNGRHKVGNRTSY